MELAVFNHKSKYAKEDSAIKIQNMIRLFLNRRRFKRNLFKLLVFKNIVEAKLHRENMRVYQAFQRLYFSTNLEEEDRILDGVKSVTSGVEYLSLESPPREQESSASTQMLKALI